ncbi:MAG TPA: hypothetical protein VMX75_03830, partial [Spirochaetia bacterium]|nr:hypothetical protein [Spirochaetia bacterium]
YGTETTSCSSNSISFLSSIFGNFLETLPSNISQLTTYLKPGLKRKSQQWKKERSILIRLEPLTLDHPVLFAVQCHYLLKESYAVLRNHGKGCPLSLPDRQDNSGKSEHAE